VFNAFSKRDRQLVIVVFLKERFPLRGFRLEGSTTPLGRVFIKPSTLT
jgi:hypothetical protein